MPSLQRRKFLNYSLLGMTLTLIMTDYPQTVLALCTGPENSSFLGVWENTTPDSPGIQKVQVEYLCEDAISCDADTGDCTPLRVGYYVNIWQSNVMHHYEWGQHKAEYFLDKKTLQAVYEDGPSTTRFQISLTNDGDQLVLNWNQSVNGEGRINQMSGTEYFTKVSVDQ